MTGCLAPLLDEAFAGDGFVCSETGATIPYSALKQLAANVAQALLAAGSAPDEPVRLVIANRPNDLAGLLGVWLAGGVAVPLHAASTAATFAKNAALTKARFSVEDGQVVQFATAFPPQRPLLRGAALIIATSGSTGLPKGVVIGHAPFKGKLDVLDGLLRLTPADHVIVPLQLTFIFGLWVTMLALRSRSRVTLVQRFSDAAITHCMNTGATVLAGVPSMLRTMLAQDLMTGAGPRMVLAGGEAMGALLRAAVQQRWKAADIHDLYGLTETGACDFCHASQSGDAATGSIGLPTAGVAYRIAHPDDGAGELQIKTPFGMLGYLDDPVLTAQSYEDGFFKTGDIARTRPDGFVDLVGRTKEIVSRGGNKVAPQEIDNLLGSHPLIAGSLTTGVPHPRLGEALYTAVVPRTGANLAVDDLRSWLAERLERFKLPDHIAIMDALPTGTTGKVNRGLLRAIALTCLEGDRPPEMARSKLFDRSS